MWLLLYSKKVPVSQYLKLHLAICRPGGQALSDPRPPASADRHVDENPKKGARWGSPTPGHVHEDAWASLETGCVCFLRPAPVMLDSPPEIDPRRFFTAVSFFAYSYENCIIIVVVVVVTSMSSCATWCCAVGLGHLAWLQSPRTVSRFGVCCMCYISVLFVVLVIIAKKKWYQIIRMKMSLIMI